MVKNKYTSEQALKTAKQEIHGGEIIKEPVAIKINEDEVLEYAESIIDTIREPLIVLDQDLRVVKVNRSFYKFFKVKPQDTVGNLIYDLGNKQWDIPKLRELLETILPQKTSFDNYEVDHDFATIGKRIMLLNARQIQRVLGKERIILLAIDDITERREIENGLEKTRKELKVIKQSADEASDFAESVINTVHEPLISLDKDLRVVTVSRSFYEFFKVKPEETVGQLIYDLGNKQWNIPKLRELLETILPQKTSFDNYEVEHDFTTIGKRIMLLNARQIQQASGKERIILLAIDDITERKKTEYMLMVQMRQVQALYSLAEIIERAGISLNEVYQELADILPKSWQYPEITSARIVIGESEFQTKNFIETEWRQSATVKVNGSKAGRIDIDYVEQKSNQDEGPFLREERMLLDAIAERLGRVIERKQLEESLKVADDRYSTLIEQSHDGVIILKNRLIFTVNQKMSAMIGFSLEEMQGKYFNDIVDPKYTPMLLDEYHRRQAGEVISGDHELELITKAGRNIMVETRVQRIIYQDQAAALITVQDITEHKQLEREKEKYAKELAEKNTELERFTYTVSHDLKSPLVTIKTFLGYLEQDIAASDTGRIEKDKLFMNNAADKMGKLLEELLEMSRVGRIANLPVKVTFDELVEDTLSITAGRIEEKGVQVRLHKEPVTLFGDHTRLVEIWQNLVENAVKFIGDQPSPKIDIGIEHQNGEIVFFVRDNGIGIEPKYQTKLFNLFEKLNPKMEGTGMGLAIAKRIVELYQGKIWMESKGLGQGSTFFFTLPGALKDNEKGV